MGVLIQGLGIGFFLCAPFGPVGILCFRRTILYGRTAGFFSVLGASFTDLMYCSIAGFGASMLSQFIEREKCLLRLAGGLVLFFIGWTLLRRPTEHRDVDKPFNTYLEAFLSTFLITFAQPVPLLIFIAAFAALKLNGWRESPVPTGLFTMGVFIGSALWAPILVLISNRFQLHRCQTSHQRANRVTGVLLLTTSVLLCLWAFWDC